MPFQVNYYTSFSGISSIERRSLIRFITRHTKSTGRQVSEAFDYALKRKPSFGGYILSARDGKHILAALVINRTGMKGYSPSHLVVFAVMNPQQEKAEEALLQLVEKAVDLTKGDLALHVEPNSGALRIYEKLGFHPHYLQLRLDDPGVVA